MSRDDFYKAVAGLAAIALFVIAVVGVSASARPWVLALVGFIALIWRRVEHAPLGDPVQGVATVALIGSLVWIVLGAVIDGDERNRSAPDPQHEASPGKVITVYNKVTSGPRMREDDKQVFLTTRAVAFCSERGCNIPGTRRETGGTYDAAVCQLEGEEITNENDINSADDHNPDIFESRRYYGVRLDGDTFGYVSEVWINPGDRGGLGLPPC